MDLILKYKEIIGLLGDLIAITGVLGFATGTIIAFTRKVNPLKFFQKIFRKIIGVDLNEIWRQIAFTNLTTATAYLEKKDFLIHFAFLKNYFNILFNNELKLDNDMLSEIETLSRFVDVYIETNEIDMPDVDFLICIESLRDKSKEMKKELHYNKLDEIFEKIYSYYDEDEINKAIEKRKKKIMDSL